MEFYIDASHEVADDILFFVRQYVPSFKSSSGSINDLEPVVVKRRVAGQTPALNDVIDWKQSFFLNLISQMPCTLTVAICTKDEHQTGKKDILDPNSSSPDLASGSGSKRANGMMATRRITKKVYASPYKSRMDVKDAFMNECSFPLVYYTVNDFDNQDLHLSISAGEYLCTELSITIPNVPSSEGYTRGTSLVAGISVADDPDPFPLPPDYSKVVLFQGAVSFKALSDVYQQKGVAAANQLKSRWGRKDSLAVGVRTEYVLMRGPHGKGQCQVAIQEPASPRSSPPPATILGFLKDTIKSQLTSAEPEANQDPVSAPEKLDCSLTFINVPWQSIATDMLAMPLN
ncbi:hypothetical protein HDV03_000972 [Kappamyces sp. JEL0829]|nr:hypothetical protein HDV03_000972 [Kappamyces sp. JEL0829]